MRVIKTHSIEIKQWDDLKTQRYNQLVLGNGASIAVDQRFKYESLYSEAVRRGLLDDSIQRVFKYFKTHDFEFVLRLLWHASVINDALQVDRSIAEAAYVTVRDALINTVQDVHVSYNEVESSLLTIAAFLGRFQTVFSLNYDLIVYWAMMRANEEETSTVFKDCFVSSRFDTDWRRFRKPLDSRKSVLVFYPHGNLILANNILGRERKISRDGQVGMLVESIIEAWEAGEDIPLFVSEGDSKQKQNAIARSSYLSTVVNEALAGGKGGVVVYGSSFADNDDHILESILSRNPRRLAVSVYADGGEEEFCTMVTRKVKRVWKRRHKKSEPELLFFDASSTNCWIY